MDRPISDDVAALFADYFYTNMLLPTGPPSPHAALKLAQENLRVSGASDGDFVQSAWLSQTGGLVRDDGELEVVDFVRAAFNRNAFRTPAVQELTLDSLRVALTDVSMALATGRLVTRETRHVFRLIKLPRLHMPDFDRFASAVRDAMNRVNRSLAVLGEKFPEFNSSPSASVMVSTGDLPQVLRLMDELDRARNQVIKVLNDYLREHSLTVFAEIPMSSLTDTAKYLQNKFK